MIESITRFSTLWVLESLAPGELKTGRNLVEGPLTKATADHPEFRVQYRTPSSKREFLTLLDLIREEAAKGAPAMVHLECHGSEKGLELANGEFLQWHELREQLIAINRACRTHLIITVAACDGAHLIKSAAVLDRAPFWAIIATEGKISAGDLEVDFGNFYRELFAGMNGDAAVGALNGGITDVKRRYKFISSAGLFARAYRKYNEKYCVGQGRQERIEELLTQRMAQSTDAELVVSEERKKIRDALNNHDVHFDRLKRRFFFIDEFPENEARYSFTREDILN